MAYQTLLLRVSPYSGPWAVRLVAQTTKLGRVSRPSRHGFLFTGHLKGSSVFFQPLPVSSGSFSRSSKGFSRSGLGTGSESHSESIHPHERVGCCLHFQWSVRLQIIIMLCQVNHHVHPFTLIIPARCKYTGKEQLGTTRLSRSADT